MKYLKFYLALITVILFQFNCSESLSIESELGITKKNKSTYLVVTKNQIFPSSDCSVNRVNIQNLIDNGTPDTIITINPGTYCIDGSLTLPSNININFSNSTIERETGTNVVFDMIVNDDFISGNVNITMEKLIIDGNYQEDNLTNVNDSHRFSGLRLVNSSDILLKDILVKDTVNGENLQNTPAAGIFVQSGNDIDCFRINGEDNFGTAIIFENSDSILVDGSLTSNNIGSGLACTFTDNSEFRHLESTNNGNFSNTSQNYSNISINGNNNIVQHVKTSGADASGLNIGHSGNSSNNNIITKVLSFNNSFEGITISDSDNVELSGFILFDNNRNNMLIHLNSSNALIDNGEIYNNSNSILTNGILIKSGEGHYINNVEIYNNKNGIYFQNHLSNSNNPTTIGNNVEIYNNGLLSQGFNSGILIQSSQGIEIPIGSFPKIYCNQPNGLKQQDYGVFIMNTSSDVNITYKAADFIGNRLSPVRNDGTNTTVTVL